MQSQELVSSKGNVSDRIEYRTAQGRGIRLSYDASHRKRVVKVAAGKSIVVVNIQSLSIKKFQIFCRGEKPLS